MVIVNNREHEMNERIREIIEQAGFEEKDGHISIQGVYMFNTHRMEKFAELIVQECMEQLNISNVPTSISAGLNLGRVAIKDHFGVEE
jgi:hypothetical protein